MNDIINIDDNDDHDSQKNKGVNTFTAQGSSSKSFVIDDERLYEDSSSQSLPVMGTMPEQQQQQQQQLNDLDDEMSDDEDGGGVGIGASKSAIDEASAGSSRARS